MGKGSTRRPTQISHEEEELRWRYATQPMTFTEYSRQMKVLLKKQGKVRR